MITKKKKSVEHERNVVPVLKKGITKFLNSEEAKITSRSLLTGSLTLFCLGILSENTLATHTSHTSYGSVHDSTGGHGNATTHANDGDAQHSSIAPHHSALPHANTAVAVPHVSGHANGGFSESTTLGALHNDATAGYGKHSAGTGHYNLGTLVNNVVNVGGSGHHSTTPHSNTGIHSSTGHTVNTFNHNSYGQHYNLHCNGADGHGSHASHGQW